MAIYTPRKIYTPTNPERYPERMRVREYSRTWILETFNVKMNQWIVQKSHDTKDAAISDMNGWY